MSLYSSGGNVEGIKEIRVYDDGVFSLSSVYGFDAGLNAQPRSNASELQVQPQQASFSSLHVQSDGYFELLPFG